MKKKLTIGLSLAALMVAGGAYAQSERPARGGDLDGDGVVTRAETQTRATTMFAWMDVNKDGKLDQTDRAQRMQEHRTAMFDRMDTNKDGQVSRTEFMAMPGPGGGEMGREKAHDGHRMGMRGPGGRHHGGDRMRGGMMGKMADADGNGAVTQAEFTAGALKRFDMMDANRDGKVTPEERKASREAMREQWKEKRQERRDAREATRTAS